MRDLMAEAAQPFYLKTARIIRVMPMRITLNATLLAGGWPNEASMMDSQL
jgi:hypothetical protein